jgi:hypothetical protein
VMLSGDVVSPLKPPVSGVYVVKRGLGGLSAFRGRVRSELPLPGSGLKRSKLLND